MPGVVVRLAGLTFNSGEDEDGDLLVVSNLDGWDGPPVELARAEKPLADGAVIIFGRLTAWTLVLSGWVVAGPDGMGPARRKLSTALYSLVDTDGVLEVDEEDATYVVTVRLDGELRTRQQGPTAITFEASLLAATPTKTPTES